MGVQGAAVGLHARAQTVLDVDTLRFTDALSLLLLASTWNMTLIIMLEMSTKEKTMNTEVKSASASIWVLKLCYDIIYLICFCLKCD